MFFKKRPYFFDSYILGILKVAAVAAGNLTSLCRMLNSVVPDNSCRHYCILNLLYIAAVIVSTPDSTASISH